MLTQSNQVRSRRRRSVEPTLLPDVAPPGGRARRRRAWQREYVRRILLGDVLAASAAAAAGYLIRFGPAAAIDQPRLPSVALALVLPLVWLSAMALSRSYEARYLWIGPEEFRRVFNAAVFLLAGVGTLSWAFKLEVARGFVVLALPLATLLTLGHRYLQRARLHRRRSDGGFDQTLLVVGHRNGIADLNGQIRREAYHGYRVIGCCLPDSSADLPDRFDDLPVLGTLDEVADVVAAHDVDAVAVLPSPELSGARLRRLGWALESTRAELMLAPAVTEVVGPRVHIRPVCGLPLLHMERPELRGIRRLTKEASDKILASVILLALLPVLLCIVAAVRVTSAGPVLFRQDRVGQDGRVFRMLKFRTMVEDAEFRVGALLPDNDGNGILFKLRDDPRVTPFGRWLRRYSLDELPQLLNVLRGHMSLVGPRPPLPREVERYGDDMHRRFLVKPGLTGLWQISGRSDLSWDDSVRIDVRYVENWSLTLDMMILWKTVSAVRRGAGAY